MIKKRISQKINKTIKEIVYKDMITVAASKCNFEVFSKIKNCNVGKEIVLCGAGPSLKQYKQIEGALHVALNRALLYDAVSYDWFIADDWDGLYFMQDEIVEYDCIKFFGNSGIYNDSRVQIPETFYRKCRAYKYYTDIYIVGDGYDSRFVCDIDKMPIGGMPNIALSAMQILLFTNPKRIYIAGCDASSNGHFVDHKNISNKGKEAHDNGLIACVSSDNIIKKWLELKEFASIYYPDIEIVSINPVGLKGIFDDIYLEKA